jgi:hypothetical protein
MYLNNLDFSTEFRERNFERANLYGEKRSIYQDLPTTKD